MGVAGLKCCGVPLRIPVAAGDGHLRALVDKKVRGGPADAAIASGNQCEFAVEFAHAGVVPIRLAAKFREIPRLASLARVDYPDRMVSIIRRTAKNRKENARYHRR